MSLIAIHRASPLVRLALAATLALPSTGGMPAGSMPVEGVVYGCPMGGHSAGAHSHAMHVASGRSSDPRGAKEPAPTGDDGDGCHCCRDCGCPAVPEAGAPPAVDAGLVPAVVVRVSAATVTTIVPRRISRALLPPATGPPVLSA